MKRKIIYVLLIVSIIGLIYFLKDPLEYAKDRKEADNIRDEIEELMEVDKKENNNDNNKEKNKNTNYSFDKVNEKYEDVKAFIQIDDLNLKYPIAQAKDNDYYLRRDLNGNYSEVGTIFIDKDNKTNLEDTNTVIYGHNMRENFPGGDAFGKLDHYIDDEFRKNANKIIKIKLPEKVGYYKIIAGYNIEKDADYRTINPQNPREYIKKLIDNSSLDFGESNRHIKEDDKIITLSTCINSLDSDYRFVIHAIKVNEISKDN